jgi:DNA-binding CsgD family transcriptional regulator
MRGARRSCRKLLDARCSSPPSARPRKSHRSATPWGGSAWHLRRWRQLRAALTLFDELAAEPWTERARAELRATGETMRRREPEERDELTPQELQIALQVAEGKTNKDVAAALFLSPKTIEFHLKRVYRKLGVRSRGELIRRFAASARDKVPS